MGAPKGNKFWEKRSTHGRKKIFETPDIMLKACVEYFEYTYTRKWNKIDFKGSDVEQVNIPTDTPFTLAGLCIFLDVNTDYFSDFTDNLDTKKNDIDKDFSRVIKWVKDVIFMQKFEGAAVGAYNANIIARDLGLADQQNRTIDDKTQKVTKIEIVRTKSNNDV